MRGGAVSVFPLEYPRRERDEVFLELTRSICPVCKRVIDAEVNVRDGRVVMSKRCPEHGPFEALVYSDADLYVAQQRFNKPGSVPLEFQTEARAGCPLDCGLCPEHKQHTCLGLIEVTSRCNLDCPICFADSGHQPDGYSLTREQVALMLDRFLAAEGAPEVLQFSGGEPSVHPEIITFMQMARARGIGTVMLNTNGLRMARDRRFAEQVAEVGAHLYLQFDGFEPRTHLAIRGRDLRADKERALAACAELGVSVTLVAALERGVNEHEAGAILRFGVAHPAVNSVVFQPVTHAGRHLAFDPMARLTNACVMRLLAEQVSQWLGVADFVPVPCCFPTCRSICYALVDHDGLLPLTRLLDIESSLDYVTNRVLPDPSARAALERMFSAGAVPGAERGLLDCETCGVDLRAAVGDLDRHAFMVVVQDFQDPYTLNVRQLMKCCIGQLTPDGRIVPFCAYNSVGYREEVRATLSGVAVEPVVPNAEPLRPLLRPTRYGSMTAAPTGARAPSPSQAGAR